MIPHASEARSVRDSAIEARTKAEAEQHLKKRAEAQARHEREMCDDVPDLLKRIADGIKTAAGSGDSLVRVRLKEFEAETIEHITQTLVKAGYDVSVTWHSEFVHHGDSAGEKVIFLLLHVMWTNR